MNFHLQQIPKFSVLVFLFFSLHPSFSQTETHQVDYLEDFGQVCEKYLLEEQKLLADSSYIPDHKGEIFTPWMAQYVQKQFLYYSILELPVQVTASRRSILEISEAGPQCRLSDQDAEDVFLSLSKTAIGWRIAGFNGEDIQAAQLQETDSLITVARDVVKKRKGIYACAKGFFEAKERFTQGEKVDSLQTYCTPSYLTLLRLGREADSLAQVYPRELTVRKLYTDWMRGDTAVVQLDVINYGLVILYAAKTERAWKIFGEKGLIGNAENITWQRQELDRIREKASVRDAILNELNPALIAYFQRGNEDTLQAITSQYFFKFMEKMKRKLGTIEPSFLSTKGMSFPVDLERKVQIDGNQARVIRFEDTLHFSRTNDTWRMEGFNQFVGKAIPESYIESHYNQLTFFWEIGYSQFNDKSKEAYLPAPEEADTMTYHYLTNFMVNPAEPELPGGLWKYMEDQMKANVKKVKKTTFAYIAFHIEVV